ncbi:MAG TPA: hypothetical protein VFQ44_01100 [Streptosporangiaceae bacterium]|nr:hypothetical protein [Streptosporangiaceae bacterium]
MSEWPGQGGQQQPYGYQDPAAGQQSWPGAFQQPGGAVQPAGQWQPPPPGQFPSPGQFQPLPGEGFIGGEPVLVSIGDISVTSTTVHTPSGSCPLSEVSWNLTDMSVTSQNIPTWAIICAVVFFVFCFVGLLFLLAKENSTRGSVQVTVHGPNLGHTTMIPVISMEQVNDISNRVGYARTLGTSSPAQLPATTSQPGDHPATQIGQAPSAQPWQQNQPPPTDQVQPWQQNQPGQPGQQNQPGQPWQPDQQGQPGQPGEPGEPGQPWQQGQPWQ